MDDYLKKIPSFVDTIKSMNGNRIFAATSAECILAPAGGNRVGLGVCREGDVIPARDRDGGPLSEA